MSRASTLLCLLVVAATAQGCNSNPTQPDLEPEIIQDDTQAGLDRYRARWDAYGVSSYRFGVFQRCVCVQNLILYNVVVEDGVPISATKTSSSTQDEPVPVEDVPYPTIDALLDLVQLGFDQEADSVGARYFTATGRPDRITIDFIRGIADDEINAFVESYEE